MTADLTGGAVHWRYRVWQEICSSKFMSFGIYVVGYLILTAGLALGAHMLHVPPRWIGVGAIIMVGLGIVSGVAKTRNRDSSS
jgi:hypothetical protein